MYVGDHAETHVAPFDWDEDGRLDLTVGGQAGTFYLFHRDWIGGLEPKVPLGEIELWKAS